MTDDLTTRLLVAIERAEQEGAKRSCGVVHPQLDTNHPEGHPDEAVLRHCAAHRKIVELHTLTWASGHPEYGYHYETTAESKRMVEVPNAEPDAPYYCATCADQGPCPTLLALAEGYDLTAEPAP